jgi:hypothetical protein
VPELSTTGEALADPLLAEAYAGTRYGGFHSQVRDMLTTLLTLGQRACPCQPFGTKLSTV